MSTYTKGPFRFQLTNGNSHTVEIVKNSVSADSVSLGGYNFDESYNVHIIRGCTLAAADSIAVYGKGIGGSDGYTLIGTLAAVADSNSFLEIHGGYWTGFKIVGDDLTGDHDVWFTSRVPDHASGVSNGKLS